MRTRCFMTLAVTMLLMGLTLPIAAQTDPTFLGSFSRAFTTFSVTEELAYPGELDWYSFDVADDDSIIFVYAQGVDEESGLRALLFDDADAYIGATENGLLEAKLAAGTYLIRIDSVGNDAQTYSLAVFNGVETESNDGLLEANELGDVAGPIRVLASLLPVGDADFFHFEILEGGLPGDSNALHIETSGASAGDTVLVLYQYNEAENRYLPIAFDDDSGDGYWSQLLLRPQPGDRYTLRAEETMYPLEGIDEYGLSITPISMSMDEEPNDTSAHATELAPTSADPATWLADGLLDADDTIDFYKVTIETSALIQINTESQSDAGDYNTLLTLYTLDGDQLAENDDSGDASWSRIGASLNAGEYFITVEVDDYESALIPYRLRIASMRLKTVSEMEPNDIDETAEPIEWIDGEALLIEAVIGLDGDIDSFRFVLNEEATIVFETGPRTGSSASNDTTLSIYDEDLWEIAYNDDADGSWSRLEETLPAGTYYVVVESYFDDESFEYTLLITQP